jgi:hypothetical protein
MLRLPVVQTGVQAERKNHALDMVGIPLPENQEVLKMDIQKGLQELHNYDTDNCGLDWPEDDEDEDDDLSWMDDLFEQYEEVTA